MTGSIALDVVIGLIFIYLLYSLLATVIMEIVATNLQLRARNLKEAINRMLKDQNLSRLQLIVQAFILPKNNALKLFYSHQEICYLGKSLSFTPAVITSENFTKVILDRIKEKDQNGRTTIERIKNGLDIMSNADFNDPDLDQVLDPETSKYIRTILEDCQYDLQKFKISLENWFDRTMEQTSDWYKQRIQIVLLVIGFFIAWFFNADTFTIVKRLSTDHTTRQQIVQLASAYIENNRYEKASLIMEDTVILETEADSYKTNSQLITSYNARLDTLLTIKKELEADISKTNNVLGLGGWLPDEVTLDQTGKVMTPNWVEPHIAGIVIHASSGQSIVDIRFWQKLGYLLLLPWYHLPGYLVTALAISLGAPFWFDLLNKLMKLRGAGGQASPTQTATIPGKHRDDVSPLDRVG